jgi:hypothetical protein
MHNFNLFNCSGAAAATPLQPGRQSVVMEAFLCHACLTGLIRKRDHD